MSVQAAAEVLSMAAAWGPTSSPQGRPFDCSVALLERILAGGSAYTNPAHEDLPAVLSRRPDLVRQGLHHIDSHAASQGMVDASPANAHPGLARGQRMAQRDGCVIAGIYTCQAQTMAIFFLPSCPDVFLFDSHSREDAGLGRAGAAFRFFRDLPDMCAYIAATFRMDVGDPADEHEAIQLAAMVVGQVDFLCLNDALEARAPVHSGEHKCRHPAPNLRNRGDTVIMVSDV